MITKILPIENDKKRVLVLTDDGERFFILKSAVKEYGLKENSIVSDNKLAEIKSESEVHAAFLKAVDSLSTSLKSQKEMRIYLRDKGFNWADACAAVDKLIGYGYINDVSYADSYISHYGKKFGRSKLIYELTTIKGIDGMVATEAVYTVFPDDAEIEKAKNIAMAFVNKKSGKEKIKEKAYVFLRGKGFDGDIILRALDDIMEK